MDITRLFNGALWRTVLSRPPRLIDCEICDGRRPAIQTESFAMGVRCLHCRGTGIHRGMYRVLQRLFGHGLERLANGSTYELSAHGALYQALQRRSKAVGFGVTCSEFNESAAPGEVINGIRSENVEALTFSDATFDLVTSTDVFEHVEDDAAGFREIARVLKPSGYLVCTVPYDPTQLTQIRAVREGGVVRHLLPPEYHGDPFRGAAGVFTWRNYGFDLPQIMERAGLRAHVEAVPVEGVKHHLARVIVASAV